MRRLLHRDRHAEADCPLASLHTAAEVVPAGDGSDGTGRHAAAEAINSSDVHLVSVQHEFGIFGTCTDGVYVDQLRPFLGRMRSSAFRQRLAICDRQILLTSRPPSSGRHASQGT